MFEDRWRPKQVLTLCSEMFSNDRQSVVPQLLTRTKYGQFARGSRHLAHSVFVPRRPFRPQLKVLLPQPGVNGLPFWGAAWQRAAWLAGVATGGAA
jgi:hypothetical protein